MSESVDDLLLSARGLLPARAGLSVLCLFAAAAALPNLEDAGLLALMILGVSGLVPALCALIGGVWVFDAPDLREAYGRAGTVFALGGFFTGVFCLTLLTQGAYAPAWWPGWGYPLLCAAAWLCWLDGPWARLGAHLAVRPKAAVFDRYRVAEQPAPAAPAAPKELPPGVEAMLVSSGSFRVDRKRMLEVLSGFQLADPSAFLLPWLRLAVASGATRIELGARGDGLELSFDGEPLGARFLADPYLALLGEEGADAERHKHLAWGLLGLLALTPRAVLGASGAAALRVEPEGAAPLKAPEADGRTVLRVVFDGWSARLRALEALAKARAAWGLADAELSIDGKPVPGWELEEGTGHRFSGPGGRGLVYGRHRPPSRRRFYQLGVLAVEESEQWSGRNGDHSVHAASDALHLDASLRSVVQDAAYEALLKEIEANLWAAGPGTTPARRRAYSKSGLAAALVGSVAAFALFAAAAHARPDLAWAAGVLYALVTAVLLVFLARWAAARVTGRRNPFR